jgi:metal-dependent amidase/aminoacylase/carboxypeptidase family protein
VLSLQLSKLYRTLFPEDRRLTLNAHSAGVDVTMTIRLVKAYLLRAFSMPLPGKIHFHFSSADRGAKGWELDVGKLLSLLEKATPVLP